MVNMSDFGVNSSEILGEASKNVGNILSQTFSPIMGILKAIGIVILVYIVILIIKAILAMKTGARIKKIAENVEEINLKLDKVINNKKEKKK